jgi:hypothetical protein
MTNSAKNLCIIYYSNIFRYNVRYLFTFYYVSGFCRYNKLNELVLESCVAEFVGNLEQDISICYIYKNLRVNRK